MLYQIYSSLKPVKRLEYGQLGAFIDELAAVLLERGYCKKYLVTRFAVIKALNDWLIQKRIKLSNFDQSRINQFIQHRSKQESMRRRGEMVTLDLLFEILRIHREIPLPQLEENPKNEIEIVLTRYNRHLVEVQGLAPCTVSNYLCRTRHFLLSVFVSGTVDLGAICVQSIITFIREYAPQYSCGESGVMISALRSFLRFLLLQGEITVDLASCVPTVPNRRLSSVPQYLSFKELEHLLEYSKGESPLQIRNYAILLLLSHLGLRASEVVALKLEDIDWEHSELVIHGKGSRQTRFPLPVDVGEALVAYLKNGRPSCSTRRVFICSKAPVKPFKGSASISSIVSRSLKKAGLNPVKKGAHLLRHTLATRCLREGATLTEVGELLRHRQIDTTAIYAKVDFTRLVTIVQAWPDPRFFGGEE